MIDNDQLRRDMQLLEDLLGQIVIEDEGIEAVQLVTEIRHLARDRRANVPGAERLCRSGFTIWMKSRLVWSLVH